MEQHIQTIFLTIYASSICEDRNFPVENKPHAEFEKVNTYPEKILAEVIFGRGYQDIFPQYLEILSNQYPYPRRLDE